MEISSRPSLKKDSAILSQKVLAEMRTSSGKFVIWGANSVCTQILDDLSAHDLLSRVAGVVDEVKQGTKESQFVVIHPTKLSGLEFDTLVVTDDANKEAILLKFSQLDKRLPKVLMAGNEHLEFNDRRFREILESCPVEPMARGYPNMLIHIYQSLVYLVNSGKVGAVAEFGVYRGGTTGFIARTLQKLGSRATIYGFDTFQGFPRRKSILDQFQESKYEFRDYNAVKGYLEPLGVKLIKGDISDTYHKLRKVPLIFSLFDTDNYTPTRNSLGLCYEQTVTGGVLAFDHYYCDERWLNTIGERIAVKEILADKRVFNLHGSGIFIKY